MPTLIFKMNSRPRTVVAAGKPTMAFFHRLRIIAKLLTGFGVLLAILASLSGWAETVVIPLAGTDCCAAGHACRYAVAVSRLAKTRTRSGSTIAAALRST